MILKQAQHEVCSYYVPHFHLTLSLRSSASLRCTSLEAAEATEAEAAEVVEQSKGTLIQE